MNEQQKKKEIPRIIVDESRNDMDCEVIYFISDA